MAGIEDDLNKGFSKALFSINQGNPWEKFLLLRDFYPQMNYLQIYDKYIQKKL